MEVMSASVRFWWAAASSSAVGAPVEHSCGSAALVEAASFRGCSARPSPSGDRGTAAPDLKMMRKRLVWFGSTTKAASGVGSAEPAIGDFPLAQGLLSIQGFVERRSGGAPPTAPWSTEWLCCRRACSVFLFSVGTFL